MLEQSLKNSNKSFIDRTLVTLIGLQIAGHNFGCMVGWRGKCAFCHRDIEGEVTTETIIELPNPVSDRDYENRKLGPSKLHIRLLFRCPNNYDSKCFSA